MNAAFARNLTELIVRDAAKFGAIQPLLERLASEPSKLLNAGAIEALSAEIPSGAQALLGAFVLDMRLALTDAIGETFLIGSVLMGFAVIAMLFVREVPLAAKVKDPSSLAEMGGELIAAEGVQPAEHEPVLVDVAEDDDGRQ